MPQDYKSRAAPRTASRPRTPCWVWFIAGILIGAFGAGLAALKLASKGPLVTVAPAPVAAPPPLQTRSPQPPPGKPAQPDHDQTTEQLPPKPRFDFYTVLPEMEVVVPDEEMKKPQTKPPAPAPNTMAGPGASASSATTLSAASVSPGKGDAFVLQMGAFRQAADADRLKARVALLGIDAEVQKVTINNKDSYHRVRSGPYTSRDEVSKLRSRLDQNQINSIVVKLRP